MITLNILKLLEDNGFGVLAEDGNESSRSLWFEKLPVGNTGVFIMSRGSQLTRGQRTTQRFDLYSRGEDDFEGAAKLEAIQEFFRDECYPVCILPDVEAFGYNTYKGVTIIPTGNVENVGQDETDRVIYMISAEIRFNKES